MAATVTLDPLVRDRLKTFGTAGMTYNRILMALMDEVDRDRFVAEMRRLAANETDWVDLKDADWGT